MAALLAGRYDWSPLRRDYSVRGFLSSLYLLVPTLVASWGLVRWLCPDRHRLRLAVLGAVAVLCVLPYRWLGLEQFHYYRDRPVAYLPDWLMEAAPRLRANTNAWGQDAWVTTRRLPPSDFRPSVLHHPPRPAEGNVPAAIALAALTAAFWAWRHRWAPQATGALILTATIAAQSWAHLSLNSPYSYVTHHYLPLDRNYWHVAYVVGDRQGVVNADVVVFHDIEEHFWGTPRPTSTMLLRRPYASYLASQLDYFSNAYQVHLLLNLGAWVVAAACIYDIGRRHFGERTARHAAILTGCGPGFLMYVGQPMAYLPGYAAMAVVAWAAVRVLDGEREPSGADWVTLTSVLALALLVYDTLAWFAFVLGYAMLCRARVMPTLASLAAAAALYAGFLLLQTRVIGLALDPTNAAPLTEAAARVLELLRGGRVAELYQLTLELARVYAGGLAGAFFVIPFLLAVAGLCAPESVERRAVVLLLLLPSLASLAFLCYGEATWSGTRLATMPRFAFSAFPAVYLLAGSGVTALSGMLRSRGRDVLATVLTASILGGAMLVANLDVILGLPQLYYWFYWGSGGHFQ
jgi:hypothetical protein